MSHQRPDPRIPQRTAADPGASAWVQASAGTGKTKVLTDRVLSLLLAGTPPQRILCLTFTKAAAAEMANRLAQKLSGWSIADDARLEADLYDLLGREAGPEERLRARRLFASVLDCPGGMKIQTIHAFCQSLLRRFPLEAGVAPHFTLMDERRAAEMMAEAREAMLLRARHGGDDALAEALALASLWAGEEGLTGLLADLAAERGRLRRQFQRGGGLAGAVAEVRAHLGLEPGETSAGIIANACEDSAFDGAACRAAVEVLFAGKPTDVKCAEKVAPWLAAAPARRVELFDSYCSAFLTNDGTVRKRLATKDCAEAVPALEAEAERLLAVRARWNAARVAEATAALLSLGAAMLDSYDAAKTARAFLDYDDLILAARDLLAGKHGEAAWVLFKLDGGLDHILIDEAQDTNPDQWAVVRALTDEFFAGRGAAEDRLRTVFAVGDSKQSIYSFQRADPRAFEEMRARLAEQVPAAEARWEEVALQVSFRSVRAVLDAVDGVFNKDGARDGVVPPGQALTHVPWREEDGGLVELWPPVAPEPADAPDEWKPPVERIRGDNPRARLARLIARRIKAMVGGEVLESKGRPIRPGDVLVLVRRRNAFVEELVRELKARDVPVAGADRLVLTEQLAVMDLVALGNALLLPEDDLTLATVLKSPLFGLSEDELFRLAHGREGTLWQALKDRAGEFPEAHALFADLLALADRVPPHELFAEVLARRGGRRRLVARLGWEAEDALDEFMALTLAYEREHAPSLQGFLRWLESGAVEIRRDMEQGSDAVRIMTVHGAKGLQAPVVFLPDTLQVPRDLPRLLWLGERGEETLVWAPRKGVMDPVTQEAAEAAREDAMREYRRLLYVAMTRAEDRLYVCGWETRQAAPEGCWYYLVKTGLEPLAEALLAPELAEDFGPEAEVLRLTCPQRRAPEAAKPEAAGGAVPAAPDWVHRQPPPEPSPPRPLAPSRTEGEEPPVRSPLGPDDGWRFRRGRLIHRLLQSLPEVPRARRSEVAARFLSRPGLGLPHAAQAEIAAEVAAVLDHPEFAPLFGPGSQAEVPVVGLVGERVVSGQVDRLAVTEDAVLVVDYKSNRPPPRAVDEVPAVYLRQMAAYRAALACVYPGRAIRCLLLWTDGPTLMPLPSARLDDALAGME